MLIKIALTAIELSAFDQAALEAAVSELLRAHRLGFHLLVISRESADYLANLDLGAQNKALLRKLYAEFTQTGALHKKASVYLNLSAGDNFSINGNAVDTPLKFITHENIGSPADILLEDASNDGFIVDFVLRNIGDVLRLPRVSF
ncbi:MAG: hypothetical protein U1D69_11475, partial [Polynucleobacter sp.]|nr:hypothetical protein [Polynucleobacter sp.]